MMPAAPRISVILPTYNRCCELARCLRGVLAQSFDSWELILADDGSTDATIALKHRLNNLLGERFREVTTHRQGPASARNRAIAMALGEYLAFVDSDDFWLPDKLTLQYQIIEQNKGAGLAFSNFSTFGDNGAVLLPRHQIPTDLHGSVYPRLLQIKNNAVVTPSVVARRDLIADLGGFDETMRVCEDIDLWNRCSRRTDVIFVDRALTAIHVRTEPFAYETSVRARIGLYKKAAAFDPGLPGQFLTQLYLEVLDFYDKLAWYRQDLEVSRVFRMARERVDSMRSWTLPNEVEQIVACTLQDLARLSNSTAA
jgi:glycosyltransferase involved in cell wall biosynthesis